jgi:hypothetical protein
MGRLIEPVGNGRARLMIEIIPVLTRVKQNPAYRFAADMPLPIKWRGLFFLTYTHIPLPSHQSI